MKNKGHLMVIFVLSLTLVAGAAVVAAEEPQTESLKLEWGSSDNLFTALGQLEKVKLKVYNLPSSKRVKARCFIFEEQASHSKAAMVKYFDGKKLNSRGKKKWREFPWVGQAYTLGETHDMSPSQAAWSYVWTNYFLGKQGMNFCEMSEQIDVSIEYRGD